MLCLASSGAFPFDYAIAVIMTHVLAPYRYAASYRLCHLFLSSLSSPPSVLPHCLRGRIAAFGRRRCRLSRIGGGRVGRKRCCGSSVGSLWLAFGSEVCGDLLCACRGVPIVDGAVEKLESGNGLVVGSADTR